jgi:hypothetical protein
LEKGGQEVKKYLAGIIIIFAACAGGPTGPDEVALNEEAIIEAEWAIAQAKIKKDYCLEKVDLIKSYLFTFKAIDGPFKCGDKEDRNGCYHPNHGLIEWNRQTPTVIRHEAGHAILHYLDHPDWRCYEHGC